MKTLHIALAALVAILLQPLLGLVTFSLLFLGEFHLVSFPLDVLIFYFAAVLVISSLVILLFGIPCFDALHRTQKLNFLSLSCCGSLLAMIPYLVIGRPQNLDGSTTNRQWDGHALMLYENSHPTGLAWVDYAVTALGFGVHGFVCSLVFYLFWRRYKV